MFTEDVSSVRLNGDKRIAALNLIYLADRNVATFPVYRFREVSKLHCARYARLAANEFFGKHYDVPASAWDLRYVYETIKATDLESQFDSGELSSGDLIGFYNPTSYENGGSDSKGMLRAYTHIALCVGRTLHGNLVFGEQFVMRRRVITLRQLFARNNEPIEIIKDRLRAA